MKKRCLLFLLFGFYLINPLFCQADTMVLTDSSPDVTIRAGVSARVYGTKSSNHITLESGAQATLFHFSGKNTVRFPSVSSQVTVSRSGAMVTFEDPNGTVLKIPATLEWQEIMFNDGSWPLFIESDKVMLGTQKIDLPPALITLGTDINSKPIAESITLNVSSSVPYIEQQLIGSDPDGDVITYELISESNGIGYALAYINAKTGMLYITNKPSGNDTFTLWYHVTDGKVFSDAASVTITVSYISEDNKELGAEEVEPEEYANFLSRIFNSDLLGGDIPPIQPESVDLSPNFPTPGDQGQQNSCVGWATAYALKTYQEKVEVGWSLNTSSHLFSPAFIYNQINGNEDSGSYISDALNLAVHKGVATLATMPYSDRDYLSQPSVTAFSEASSFKAEKWYRINDTSQIKAALVNRRPVVCGISVYQSLYNLYGSDSVYNTATGSNLGGHAVTIVGYDDNKFGGAFKVINSWGINWGDNGYFWLPYSFASQGIINETYILEDAENGQRPEDEDPTEPEPVYNDLPNLSVSYWNANYDPRPRGSGSLTYEVINSGSGIAFSGAYINLMLSKNSEINSSDIYVVYEDIPYDLSPGQSVYRNDDNALSFNFPDSIESGVYYMALWVDDLGAVAESNEKDNVSLGSNTVMIENSLPDISVNSWYAEWDGYGDGTLTYEVENSGASRIDSKDWYINLILDKDQTLGNGNEIFLFYEEAGFSLSPGGTIFRDNSSPAYVNVYKDAHGNDVPSGVYYMALWVDDLDQIVESNELNNGSYGWNTLDVSNYYGDNRNAVAMNPGRAYNGKKLPPKDVVMRKVMITKTMSGGIRMQMLKDEPVKKLEPPRSKFQTKKISSKAGGIFPSVKRILMPNRMPSHEK